MSQNRQTAVRSPEWQEMAVHLFVAADGPGAAADRNYLASVWDACGQRLGMTEPVPALGYPVEPPAHSWEPREVGVLAARGRSGGGVRQAVLRREADTWCVSLVLAPDPDEQLGWADLDSLCTEVLGEPTEGVIGVARLYTAFHPARTPPPRQAVPAQVRQLVPAAPGAPASWPDHGARLDGGLTVWDASAAGEEEAERRLLVLCPEALRHESSATSWIGAGPDLPLSWFARYLLHAAKLRYQLRVWRAGREPLFALRRAADTAIAKLLPATPSSTSGVRSRVDVGAAMATTRTVDVLQWCQLGLIDGLTRLREVRRTVEIATGNMESLGAAGTGRVFADDRALADWFLRQLDDDAHYVENAVQRADQIGALAGQLVERGLRRRQESLNLGLTGVVGAILMGLTAIQAFAYTVRVPHATVPALIALLGSFALASSMSVANIVTSRHRWTVVTGHVASGCMAASLIWLLVTVVEGGHAGLGFTAALSGIGLLAGLFVSIRLTRHRRRRAPQLG
ncbi:CATRA conflict system CASPASE/TPR repeat-associated protein [Streptomyces sp. NPDC058409]|uniref:CATRA conflict system CASPASE/TPR repeat-associated protein n=1 Tax=Streptomyces sp. NPDC058409 TaxID=3346484 RepID=UPI00364A149E